MSTELTTVSAAVQAAFKPTPPPVVETITATIPSSGTTSGAVDLRGTKLAAIITPAALTGTALAIHASDTADGTYTVVTTADGAVSIPVAASGNYAVDDELFKRYQFIKLVSNATEAAERVFTLITIPSGV